MKKTYCELKTETFHAGSTAFSPKYLSANFYYQSISIAADPTMFEKSRHNQFQVSNVLDNLEICFSA